MVSGPWRLVAELANAARGGNRVGGGGGGFSERCRSHQVGRICKAYFTTVAEERSVCVLTYLSTAYHVRYLLYQYVIYAYKPYAL